MCMILLAQLYLIGQMKGVGNVFQVMFHWDYTTGLIVGGLVVTTYVTIGGMYGLSYNQTLQAIIMGIALFVPAAIILWKLGAGPASVFPPFGYANWCRKWSKRYLRTSTRSPRSTAPSP